MYLCVGVLLSVGENVDVRVFDFVFVFCTCGGVCVCVCFRVSACEVFGCFNLYLITHPQNFFLLQWMPLSLTHMCVHTLTNTHTQTH